MWPFSSMIRDNAMSALTEERTFDSTFLTFGDIGSAGVHAGVPVSETTAVNLPAVYKCVSLNAETISSLPVDVYAKRGKTRVEYPVPLWLQKPNQFQTLAEFIAMTQTSLDLDGNAFWMKASDQQARLAGLYVLAPTAVDVKLEGGRLVYWVNAGGQWEPFGANEIVHLRSLTMPGEWRGLSPIECAKQTIGIGLAAEQYAGQFYGNGAHLSGVITSPGSMTQEQAERLKESFTKRHGGISKSHAVGILSGGAAWVPMGVSPGDSMFLESRRYSAAEIANLYGVPVELVGDGGTQGAKGYVTGVAMRFRLWYLTGLLPRITRIEAAFSGLLPRPAYVHFNTNALLRMDPAERTAFYQAAQLGEWMSRNQIREKEDMDPIAGGDEFLHSVQWQENAPEMPDDEPDDEPEAEDPDALS